MSASHNPGGPEYDWGIKVTFLISSHPYKGHGSIMYWLMLIDSAPWSCFIDRGFGHFVSHIHNIYWFGNA